MEAPVREGEVLAGKYRVDRVLGVGGMGVVVAATHLQLDQKVALKFMLREAFQDAESLARFQREARAAVRLKSEHVARVSDTGTFDNGSPYIVMEFLEGTDLSKVLETSGPLAPQVVAEYVVQACDALAEAHKLGIVHRDLKPANLFLTRRADGSPLVKVLDFGISKASSLTDPGLAMTKTSAMMGSPFYMSPEQIRSAKDVDARADVWSLGVVMYELLGGRVPFMSDTLGGLVSAIMVDPLRPLGDVRPDLPPALVALVARCLEKQVTMRCQTVGEIARGLAPFCPPRALPIVERVTTLVGGGPIAATQVLPPPALPVPAGASSALAASVGQPAVAPSAHVTSGTVDSWGSTAQPTSAAARGPSPLVLIGVASFLTLGLAGGFLWSRAARSPAGTVGAAGSTSAAEAPKVEAPPSPEAVASAPSVASFQVVQPAPSASSSAGASSALKPPRAAVAPSKPESHAAVPTPAIPAVASAAPTPPAATSAPKKPGILDTSN